MLIIPPIAIPFLLERRKHVIMAKKKGPKLKKSQRKRSKYQCPPHMDPEEFQARRKAKYSKEGRAMLKADQQARRMFGYNKLKSRLTKQGHVSAAQPRYQVSVGVPASIKQTQSLRNYLTTPFPTCRTSLKSNLMRVPLRPGTRCQNSIC